MNEQRQAILAIGSFIGVIAIARVSKAKTIGQKKIVPNIQGRKPSQEVLLSTLLPPFRAKISMLLSIMNDNLGFDTIIANSARTAEQALANAKKGIGIIDSMHNINAGVDLMSRSKGWNDKAMHQALGPVTKRLGLTWGGNWAEPNYDPAHVQAVPVAYQQKFRELSIPDRIKYLERLYKW